MLKHLGKYTEVKIKMACSLYGMLCHSLIFIMYEKLRLKNLSKGWNIERSRKILLACDFENTYNTNWLLSKVLENLQVFCCIFKMYFKVIQVVN